MHSARSLLVKQKTMLANAMRGLATEFGVTVPRGIGRLEELVVLADVGNTLPGRARQVIRELLPDWVRARGLAIFVMGFFGSMTVGSMLWGQVASASSIAAALLAAAILMLLGIVVTRRQPLQVGAELDLTPSSHWPTPVTDGMVSGDRGPVLVTVDYRFDAADRPAFLEELRALSAARRRDGGFGWGIFEDAARPDHVRECFYLESWHAHLRQHERVTAADRSLQERVRAFHRGEGSPAMHHHLPL